VPQDVDDFAAMPISAAYFVPEATSALWDGELLTVTFREAGLLRDAFTTVTISGEAAVDAVCRQNDKILFSLHSHSAVSDESVYQADENGTTDSTVVLQLTARVAGVDGTDFTFDVNRSFSVTISDLDTGATTFVSGTVE
jgi:hypothetical protein